MEDVLWQWALCSHHFSVLINGLQYLRWNGSPRMADCMWNTHPPLRVAVLYIQLFIDMHSLRLSFGTLLRWGSCRLGMELFSDFQHLWLRISVFHRPRRIRSTESLYLSSIFFPSSRIFITFSPSCFFRENDVAGIDVNMGCPKEYSTKVKWFLYVPYKYTVQIKWGLLYMTVKYSIWLWASWILRWMRKMLTGMLLG